MNHVQTHILLWYWYMVPPKLFITVITMPDTLSTFSISDNSVHSTKVSSLAPHPQLLVCGAKSSSVGAVPASLAPGTEITASKIAKTV